MQDRILQNNIIITSTCIIGTDVIALSASTHLMFLSYLHAVPNSVPTPQQIGKLSAVFVSKL